MANLDEMVLCLTIKDRMYALLRHRDANVVGMTRNSTVTFVVTFEHKIQTLGF